MHVPLVVQASKNITYSNEIHLTVRHELWAHCSVLTLSLHLMTLWDPLAAVQRSRLDMCTLEHNQYKCPDVNLALS